MKEKLKALILPLLVVLAGAMLGVVLHQLDKIVISPDQPVSSVGCPCERVGDTLHWKYKGDTVRLDLTKFREDEN